MSVEEKLDFVAQYGSDAHVNKILDSGYINGRTVALNPSISEKTVNKLIDNGFTRHDVLARLPLKDHQIDHAMKDNNEDNINALAKNPHLKAHHITRLLHVCDNSSAQQLAESKNFNTSHTQHILDDKRFTPYTKTYALYSGFATSDQIHQVLKSDLPYHCRLAAIRSDNATQEHKDIAKKDPDYRVREAAGADE